MLLGVRSPMTVATERSRDTANRLAQLHPAALLAHCDQLLAGPMPDYVLDGLLDKMARLSPDVITAWEAQQRRPKPPRRESVTTSARKNLKVNLEWRNPPQQSTSRQRDWQAILEPLRHQPGKWARLVNDHRANTVQGARTAAKKALPGPEWELVTRREDDGTVSFYARYLSLTPGPRATTRVGNGHVSALRP